VEELHVTLRFVKPEPPVTVAVNVTLSPTFRFADGGVTVTDVTELSGPA
jgi:hypothetical protein